MTDQQRFVLVVDEDSQPARFLGERLGKDEVDIQFMSDPSRAYDMAKERKPALVLLSADLPAGLDTCDRFKKRRNLHDVPVVVMSNRGAMRSWAILRNRFRCVSLTPTSD